jgi:chromate transporter
MENQEQKIGALEIFLTFTQISLIGFGGVLFWSRHVLVERRRWITEREYVDALALGQLLPGPNVFNLALMVGYRFAGYRGAAAAGIGFMGWPFLMVIGMGMLYERYQQLPIVQQLLSGMSAVALGLLFANGIKMAAVLPRRWRPWLFGVLAFVSVGVLRWPLIGILCVLAPLAIAAAWWEKR